MNIILTFIKSHKAIFALIIILIAFMSLAASPKNTPTMPAPNQPSIIVPNPTIFSRNTLPNQKATIGQTTESQLQSIPGLIEEKPSSEGGKIFSYTSSLIDRPGIVITNHNKVAIFERGVIPSGRNLYFSEIKSTFGTEEKIIIGSSYGKAVNTYIYASRGIAILANPYADEVYEIQRFTPMSIEKYISSFADPKNITNAEEGN